MSITDFTIRDSQTNNVVGSGSFTYDENTRVISAVTGSINGVKIDGLTDFDGSDNILGETSTIVLNYSIDVNGADQKGIAFIAGGVSYNVKSTENSDTSFGVQTGDSLVDSNGNVESVTLNAGESTNMVCFATGSAIRTRRGDILVEDLSVGDRAMTPRGDARRICWIGHRTIDLRNHSRPHDVYPVRVSAHAFGEGRPTRDLLLSPGHPVLVDADEDGAGGHLVPIMFLINGTTIERVAKDEVTYWHIELEQHDILLAENLPAESYLDWGDRAFFTEGVDHALANPDFVVPGLAARCRPVAIDGPIVEAERRRLDEVFAARLVADCSWPKIDHFFGSLGAG